MEWIEGLNKAISYIEEHLTEEISYDELARIACCSAYHFQRMFAYMAGGSAFGIYPTQANVFSCR